MIIPSYNAPFLKESVQSVLEQSHQHLEVIVIDDGSDKDIFSKKDLTDERLRYFRIEHSGSPAKPRNIGIKEAKGDLVAFLDADDIWLPAKIEEEIKLLKSGHFDLVHCDGSVIDEKEQVIKSSFHRDIHTPSGKVFPDLFKGNFIVTSSVLLKKSCFKEVGVFSSSRSLLIGEDYDLWLRMAEKFRIGYLDKKLFLYREYKGSLSDEIELKSREYELSALQRNFTAAKRVMGLDANTRILRLIKVIQKFIDKDLYRILKYKFLTLLYLPWETGNPKLIRRFYKIKV